MALQSMAMVCFVLKLRSSFSSLAFSLRDYGRFVWNATDLQFIPVHSHDLWAVGYWKYNRNKLCLPQLEVRLGNHSLLYNIQCYQVSLAGIYKDRNLQKLNNLWFQLPFHFLRWSSSSCAWYIISGNYLEVSFRWKQASAMYEVVPNIRFRCLKGTLLIRLPVIRTS